MARSRSHIGLYKIIFFSKYGHVAYQMEGNEAYNNMIANILHLHTPLDPFGGVKRSFFSFLEEVMMHSKLTGMKHGRPCKQMLCPFAQHRPLDWVKGQTFF